MTSTVDYFISSSLVTIFFYNFHDHLCPEIRNWIISEIYVMEIYTNSKKVDYKTFGILIFNKNLIKKMYHHTKFLNDK